MSLRCTTCHFSDVSVNKEPCSVCKESGRGFRSFWTDKDTRTPYIEVLEYSQHITDKIKKERTMTTTTYVAKTKQKTYPIEYYVSREHRPKQIIVSGPATIVLWEDDTKTIVKCAEGETPDLYIAFTAALAKKIYGANSRLKKTIKKCVKVQGNE